MPQPTRNFLTWLWNIRKDPRHTLLPQNDSPTISPSTTVTNFPSCQSLSKYDQYDEPLEYFVGMGTKEQNVMIGTPLRVADPEAKYSTHHITDGSVNSEYSPYNDTTTDAESDDREPPPRMISKQVLAAISVSLGSMTVGYASAYTSPALVSMMNDNSTFTINKNQESWIGSLMPLSALVGGVLGGLCLDLIGRKRTILMTAVPFILSWILMASAIHVHMLYAARVIGGFCVGVTSVALPVYLGETVQPEIRGMLGLLPTALGNIGILVVFTAGTFLDWSQLAILGAVLPVPFMLLMFIIPETPRWYVSKGNDKRAEASLTWLRGKINGVVELANLQNAQAEANKNANEGRGADLLQRQNLKPLFISLGLMFLQQLSGINAVIFYTVTIFKSAGSTIDGNLCTIIIGIVNFISTFVATLLIDRLGRKILLYISALAMTVTLNALAVYFYFLEIKVPMEGFGWLPLVSMVVYVIGFSLGFGPIPWLMMGEILPAKVRGQAASIVTGFNWACTFIVTKFFNDVQEIIGAHGAFGIFGLVCFAAIFFTKFCVPETQGRSLEDIQLQLQAQKVRKRCSIANIKPLPTAC